MKLALRPLLAILAWVVCAGASAQDEPKQQEFEPKEGPGRVVVLISGQTGADNYNELAKNIAAKGYDVVLVDGNDFWVKGGAGLGRLKGVIQRARQSPHAKPGKVGVVAASLGGGPALSYAARMPETVGAVVAQYPLTSYVTDPADFVGKLKVPTLILAGTFDTYKNCCRIETARALNEAAAATPGRLELHEYPGVDHGFSTNDSRRRDIAADALDRTLDFLAAHLAAE